MHSVNQSARLLITLQGKLPELTVNRAANRHIIRLMLKESGQQLKVNVLGFSWQKYRCYFLIDASSEQLEYWCTRVRQWLMDYHWRQKGMQNGFSNTLEVSAIQLKRLRWQLDATRYLHRHECWPGSSSRDCYLNRQNDLLVDSKLLGCFAEQRQDAITAYKAYLREACRFDFERLIGECRNSHARLYVPAKLPCIGRFKGILSSWFGSFQVPSLLQA